MRSRLIPVSDLQSIIHESWVDTGRKPFITPEGAYVPVGDGYPASCILPERNRVGRGYQRIGDVIAFHGARPSDADLADVVSRENPRGVIWIEGHDGVIRKPRITVLYGSAGEVTHRESGISYRLNVETVMFSQGNRREKSRIATLIQPGESVCDMFAGIGYFTLPMAKAGAQVFAIEINPTSYSYLQENIIINRVSGLVTTICGDCRDHMCAIFDRIHMGHFDAVDFLPVALNHCRRGSVLHVHMLGDRSSDIQEILQMKGIDAMVTVHRVKKSGPRTWHQVADLVIM